MRIAVIGIDLGKNVCSVIGLDERGTVVLRRRTRRDTLITLVSEMSPCIVAMEPAVGPTISAGCSRRTVTTCA